MPKATASWKRWNVRQLHDKLLAAASAILCVTSQIKFAEIQLLELLYAFDLVVIIVWFLSHPAPLAIFRPFYKIGARWFWFAVFSILLAAWNLQQDFFIGEGVSLLKQPFNITLSRLAELFLDVFFMLYLATVLRTDDDFRRWTAWFYYTVGVVGAVYSVLSEFLIPFHFQLGAYGNYRMRGFNNEGGSYGTYLMTVVFVTMVMKNEKWISRPAAILSYFLLGVCLIGSQSKAVLFEVALLIVILPVLRMRGAKVFFVSGLTAAAVAILFVSLDIPSLVRPYLRAIDEYHQMSLLRPDDGNYVLGRAAGLYFAPKMIASRPIVGIGLGNYPIVRDAPEYRQGTPIVATNLDSPSLGPIDYIVDLGFPLFLYFTWVEIAPAIPLVRARAGFGLFGLVFMQPLANWFGAHLNLTYPWVAGALGLALFYGHVDRNRELENSVPLAAPAPPLEVAS
jgi:hypothetical protein